VLTHYDGKEKVLASYPVSYELNKEYHLELIDEKDGLLVRFDDREYRFAKMELRDLFGISLGKNCRNRTVSLSL